jgi:hypothetical protein
MNSTLLQIELIPKMQTDIARKFKLKALCSEARKFKLCLSVGRHVKLSSMAHKIKLRGMYRTSKLRCARKDC